MSEHLPTPEHTRPCGQVQVELRQPASLVPEYVEGRAPEVLRSGPATSPTAGATYYGLAPIKGPHWQWQVPTYFWVGGLAAGSYLVALLAALGGRTEERGLVRWGRYLALLGLAVSPALLIDDLGRPERFHYMLRIFKARSMINVGTWALTAFGGLTGIVGLFQFAADLGPRRWAQRLHGLARTLSLFGAPLAVLVATYTGVLLSATSVVLWARARVHLAPMFFASALATGAAAVALAARPTDRTTRRRLAQVIASALGVELAHAAALERRLGAAGHVLTATALYRCSQALALLALALCLPALRRSTGPSQAALAVGSLATLAGGFALRWAAVMAGKRSAERPEDYFAWTRAAGCSLERQL